MPRKIAEMTSKKKTVVYTIDVAFTLQFYTKSGDQNS